MVDFPIPPPDGSQDQITEGNVKRESIKSNAQCGCTG